jgi:hypothetical protein
VHAWHDWERVIPDPAWPPGPPALAVPAMVAWPADDLDGWDRPHTPPSAAVEASRPGGGVYPLPAPAAEPFRPCELAHVRDADGAPAAGVLEGQVFAGYAILTVSQDWCGHCARHRTHVETLTIPSGRFDRVLELAVPPQDAVLRGTVRNEEGTPVAQAHVSAHTDEREVASTMTDHLGRYELRTVSGAQRIEVFAGIPWRATVDLGKGPNTLDVRAPFPEWSSPWWTPMSHGGDVAEHGGGTLAAAAELARQASLRDMAHAPGTDPGAESLPRASAAASGTGTMVLVIAGAAAFSLVVGIAIVAREARRPR